MRYVLVPLWLGLGLLISLWQSGRPFDVADFSYVYGFVVASVSYLVLDFITKDTP